MTVETRGVAVIRGISSMATRGLLHELAELYGQRSGRRVAVVSMGGVEAARRLSDGEAFDFAVLAADAIAQLASKGRLDPCSRTDLARSGVAIAVAAGAPHPDVESETTVRNAILNARSVGYSTGPSGAHLERLFERWGIAEVMAPRIVQAPPGVPVATLIASGQIELGFQQLSELIHQPGIDVVGALPPEIQVVTVFSAALCTASTEREASSALLRFLASPAADVAKRRHGMDPTSADSPLRNGHP